MIENFRRGLRCGLPHRDPLVGSKDELMAVVGAYARIDLSEEALVPARLEALEGVSTFTLDEPGKIGLVIEAGSLDEAHALLLQKIEKLEGVLGVFPVYAHAEPEEDEGPRESQGAADEYGFDAS